MAINAQDAIAPAGLPAQVRCRAGCGGFGLDVVTERVAIILIQRGGLQFDSAKLSLRRVMVVLAQLRLSVGLSRREG